MRKNRQPRQTTSSPQRRASRAIWTLFVVAGLTLAFFFPHAGRFLVVEDAFDHAEIGLVLSGSPAMRTLGARELYRQSRIGSILIIPEPEGPVFEALVRLGLEDPDQPLAERILLASGVPQAKIEVLPRSMDGTINEARYVRASLRGRLPRQLALITSKSASRRARHIFRHVFRKDGVMILSSPTPYDGFQADRWWTHPRNALTVLTEYQKLCVNVLSLWGSGPGRVDEPAGLQ